MVVNELHGCQIPKGAMRPLLVVLPPPGLNHDLGLLYRQKPVLVQALISKRPVAALNKRILHRFPRLNKV